MFEISNNVSLADWEIELTGIRATGNGGQRVNKVETLPAIYKERLLKLSDSLISSDGIIISKAQSFRTQSMNKDDALKRLKELIISAMIVQKSRRPTKPTRGSVQRRLTGKANRKDVKQTRKKVQL